MYFIEDAELKRIILDKLLGVVLPQEEEALFSQWLQSSTANRAAFARLLDGEIIANYADAVSRISLPDKTRETHGKIKSRRRRRRKLRFGATAAVLLVGIVSTVLIGNRNPRIGISDLVSQQVPRAILSLSEDETIELLQNEQGENWRKYIGDSDVEQSFGHRVIKIAVPRGSDFHLQLDDGSSVWLNSESSIEYCAGFPTGRREVKLSGEAYFEVVADKNNPFAVTSGNAEIVALGTSFNISAYETDDAVTATLVEGLVEIASSGQSVRLTPGIQARVGAGGSISLVEVDTSLYTSWTKGVFDFENMPLKDICMKLARWYGVDFEFNDDTGNERFSGGAWKNAPLEEFLLNIELATDVKFAAKNGKIAVTSAN